MTPVNKSTGIQTRLVSSQRGDAGGYAQHECDSENRADHPHFMSRRCGHDQRENGDNFDARIKALQQAVRLGEILGVQRMLHRGQKIGESALKKAHGVFPVHAEPMSRQAAIQK